ncbi:DMT family transporter [Amycolatopsis sp. H6(2020)]|nr:DMT family transporter [Amycolatopsis sp. H6(2020)]
MATLLALASALCYGLSDFGGGLLARRINFATVAFFGQAGALVVTAAAVPLNSTGAPAPADLVWGGLSGLGTGVGMLFLFRGLSRGAMTVVVPVSAVGGLALPVLVGVLLLGEQPSTLSWLGIAVALPALWLVSTTGGKLRLEASPALVDGLIAGVGIALQYLALAQSGPHSGLWPVLSGRVIALLTLLPLIFATHASLRLRPSATLACAATGVAAALALVCFLAATRLQLAVIAVALSSLYPAVPVLLGITTLHERLTRFQVAGLVGAGTSIALLAIT